MSLKLATAVLALAVIVLVIVHFSSDEGRAPVSSNSISGHEERPTFEFSKQGGLSFTTSEGGVIATIDIEIADTDEKRRTGMMYRDKLAEKQGILFIFPQERYLSFWMRNTVVPLDMFFVNSGMEIVTIHRETVPFTENPLVSDSPALYVVEVNAGFADKLGITVGDMITWHWD